MRKAGVSPACQSAGKASYGMWLMQGIRRSPRIGTKSMVLADLFLVLGGIRLEMTFKKIHWTSSNQPTPRKLCLSHLHLHTQGDSNGPLFVILCSSRWKGLRRSFASLRGCLDGNEKVRSVRSQVCHQESTLIRFIQCHHRALQFSAQWQALE
jgi:hypothetical protein